MSQTPVTEPVTIEDIRMIDTPGETLGYEIIMSDTSKNIYLSISNSQNCCEQYGVHTESSLYSFIGAIYTSIDIHDISDNEDKFDSYSRNLKIDIYTDRGIFDITFYNQHNGYYSHCVSVQSERGCFYENL